MFGRMKLRIFQLILALFLCSTAWSQTSDTTSILFVGNSYTYFWNLPQVIEVMAENQGLPLKSRGSTAGGASWQDHWDGNKDLHTRDVIASSGWDYVVLQNHSLSTINNPEDFQKYGSLLIDYAQKHGATVLLYETWAREFDPTMQARITKGYESLGSLKGANTVPVGQMWELIRSKRPDIQLYDADRSHPSSIGTYVVACMFFATLTGKSIHNLPSRVRTTDKHGQPLYLLIIDPGDGQFIKNMVDMFLELE